MSGLEAVERLVELVRRNTDIAHYADGCDQSTIVMAEEQLGLRFPPSYRQFIAEVGTCDVAGEEFLGVYQTAAAGLKLLGSVAVTLEARGKYGLPRNFIVMMLDGMGGMIVLDSAQPDVDGEYPVLGWNPGMADGRRPERLGVNFGVFALELCEKAIARWRASP